MNTKTWFSQRGQGLVEYALITSLVAIVVIGILLILGPTIGNVFSNVTDALEELPPTEEIESPMMPTPTPTPLYTQWDDWHSVTGRRWGIEGDDYCVRAGGEHRSFYGQENWTDYEITVEANLYRGNGYGVYFRATNYDRVNAYIFQYDPGWGSGAFLYRQIIDGRERGPFAVARASKVYGWHDVAREMRIRVEGNVFQAYIDGQMVLEATHSAYTHGGVGLRTWDGSRVCFRDLKIAFITDPERDRERK